MKKIFLQIITVLLIKFLLTTTQIFPLAISSSIQQNPENSRPARMQKIERIQKRIQKKHRDIDEHLQQRQMQDPVIIDIPPSTEREKEERKGLEAMFADIEKEKKIDTKKEDINRYIMPKFSSYSARGKRFIISKLIKYICENDNDFSLHCKVQLGNIYKESPPYIKSQIDFISLEQAVKSHQTQDRISKVAEWFTIAGSPLLILGYYTSWKLGLEIIKKENVDLSHLYYFIGGAATALLATHGIPFIYRKAKPYIRVPSWWLNRGRARENHNGPNSSGSKLLLSPQYNSKDEYIEAIQGKEEVFPLLSSESEEIKAIVETKLHNNIELKLLKDFEEKTAFMSYPVMVRWGKNPKISVIISERFYQFLSKQEHGRLFLDHILKEELYEICHNIRGSFLTPEGKVDTDSVRFKGEVASSIFAFQGYAREELLSFANIIDSWYSELELELNAILTKKQIERAKKLSLIYKKIADNISSTSMLNIDLQVDTPPDIIRNKREYINLLIEDYLIEFYA